MMGGQVPQKGPSWFCIGVRQAGNQPIHLSAFTYQQHTVTLELYKYHIINELRSTQFNNQSRYIHLVHFQVSENLKDHTA